MKTKWKVIFLQLGIVLVSLLVGGLVGVKWAEHALKRRHAPEMWNHAAMRALQGRLKLTPEQTQKTQAIIDGGVEEMKGIRLETISRTDAVIERMLGEIDHLLTPEQSAELKKLKQQRGATTIDMLKVEPRKK